MHFYSQMKGLSLCGTCHLPSATAQRLAGSITRFGNIFSERSTRAGSLQVPPVGPPPAPAHAHARHHLPGSHQPQRRQIGSGTPRDHCWRAHRHVTGQQYCRPTVPSAVRRPDSDSRKVPTYVPVLPPMLLR